MRSGRKLKPITESPPRIRASSPTVVAAMNSSVSSRSYAARRRVGRRVGVVLAVAVDEQVVGLLHAVPALVAVHREVAPDHRADARVARLAAPALDRLEVALAAVRGGVAAVGERVHDDVGDAALGRQLDQRLQVVLGRVHAAVGDQADQVQPLRVGHRRREHLVLRQRAVLHRRVDAGEVLRDDRARAEVEVADLGVAHLARGQADGLALGGQRRVRVALPELVEHRRVRERDRVALARRSEPPAVEHDEADAGDGHQLARSPRAVSTICANGPGSRLDPPQSAPSTSGSASSSSALSGLSEPP